jgi:hypothetical protein
VPLFHNFIQSNRIKTSWTVRISQCVFRFHRENCSVVSSFSLREYQYEELHHSVKKSNINSQVEDVAQRRTINLSRNNDIVSCESPWEQEKLFWSTRNKCLLFELISATAVIFRGHGEIQKINFVATSWNINSWE